MPDSQFSWAAAGDVSLGLAGVISGWGSNSANRILSSAVADAQNKVRTAQNQERVAALGLAGTVRSLAQQAALTNAGEAVNSESELIVRTHQAMVRGQFEQGLRDMENIGAFAARASAAGVGGASVRQVTYSMQLQQDRRAQQVDQTDQQQTYELLKQRSGIMPATISRLDVSPLNANMDYGINLPPSGSPANLTTTLIQGLLSKRESLQTAIDSISRPDAPYPMRTASDTRGFDAPSSPSIMLD